MPRPRIEATRTNFRMSDAVNHARGVKGYQSHMLRGRRGVHHERVFPKAVMIENPSFSRPEPICVVEVQLPDRYVRQHWYEAKDLKSD